MRVCVLLDDNINAFDTQSNISFEKDYAFWSLLQNFPFAREGKVELDFMIILEYNNILKNGVLFHFCKF